MIRPEALNKAVELARKGDNVIVVLNDRLRRICRNLSNEKLALKQTTCSKHKYA